MNMITNLKMHEDHTNAVAQPGCIWRPETRLKRCYERWKMTTHTQFVVTIPKVGLKT